MGAAFLDGLLGDAVEPSDKGNRAGLGEGFGRARFAVGVNGLGDDAGAEGPIGDGQTEETGDRLVTIDHGVMAEVEAVNGLPKPAPVLVGNEWGPLFEGPVIDGVEDLVKGDRGDEGGEAAKEPRKGGQQKLQ